ncbi:hypothetical protein FGRMN_5076 [Fusarium graminum]|nr:hypothetical protein FGRMN_5076 [Fusarium graminum]
MASNPSPSNGLPLLTNSAPRHNSTGQPTLGTASRPAPQGQVAPCIRRVDNTREKVELLTINMLRRLEQAVASRAGTDASLQGLGVNPENYGRNLNLVTGFRPASDVSIDEVKDQSGAKKRVKIGQAYINGRFQGQGLYRSKNDVDQLILSLKHASFDIITALCCNLELAVEIGKHLPPKDIINLYIASVSFRKAVKSHMLACIRLWIDYNAREAGEVFHWRLYGKILIKDPAGRVSDVNESRYLENRWETSKTNPANIRLVPGLKYLQLVLGRDRYCSEILAIMARMGFRMPETMHSTLLRLWVLLEISTTRQRQLFLRNQNYWTEQHIYNVQFFLVKLAMAFVHPFFQPHTTDMVRLMMGQKGLFPLWQLLMRQKYTNITEIMELKARYDLKLSQRVLAMIQDEDRTTAFGISLEEIGLGHREGWGKGLRHLARPDEIIPIEAVLRGLYLDDHITQMMIWGYIDFETGENLVPTEEEMHISDEEEKLGKTDRAHHWQRKHALKKRWAELTPEEQQEIKDDDEDERLRAMAWSSGDIYNSPGDEESESEDESDGVYDINAEINRGYCMPALPKVGTRARDTRGNSVENGSLSGLFAEDLDGEDKQAWQTLYTNIVRNAPPGVTNDEFVVARAWKDWMDGGQQGIHPQSSWFTNPTVITANEDEDEDEDGGVEL